MGHGIEALGARIERDAEEILQRWYRAVTEQKRHANAARRDEVLDDLLETLRAIGRGMQGAGDEDVKEAARLAQKHGQQRAGIGWDITDLIDDYELLHRMILTHVKEQTDAGLQYDDAIALTQTMGVAIRSSLDTYGRYTQRNLDNQIRQQKSKLRQLTLELSEAQHRERREIAKLLHDELQQMLVAGQWKLRRLSRVVTADSHRNEVAQVHDLLQLSTRLARNLTADLYPVALEYGDLRDALRWLADSFQQRHGLTVSLELSLSPEGDVTPLPIRRLVYDAIRELLFNVVKHARTNQARVCVCGDEDSPWRIEVEDHGIGFSLKEHNPTVAGEVRFGLGSARHRIEQLGGTMEVKSEPGKGTRVVLMVPLEPPSD